MDGLDFVAKSLNCDQLGDLAFQPGDLIPESSDLLTHGGLIHGSHAQYRPRTLDVTTVAVRVSSGQPGSTSLRSAPSQ